MYVCLFGRKYIEQWSEYRFYYLKDGRYIVHGFSIIKKNQVLKTVLLYLNEEYLKKLDF